MAKFTHLASNFYLFVVPMLHILRKILTADPEKFYKAGKFTDQQTHTDTDTHKQRERKTKDKKLFHYPATKFEKIPYSRSKDICLHNCW